VAGRPRRGSSNPGAGRRGGGGSRLATQRRNQQAGRTSSSSASAGWQAAAAVQCRPGAGSTGAAGTAAGRRVACVKAGSELATVNPAGKTRTQAGR